MAEPASRVRRALPGAALLAATLAAVLALVASADRTTVPAATIATPPTTAAPTLAPAPARSTPPVEVDLAGEYGWALLDRDTGQLHGSGHEHAVGTTASVIKTWLAADHLRRAAADGRTPTPGERDRISMMIRDSENGPADELHQQLGGAASIDRLVATCGLTATESHPDGWARTRTSPGDLARLGACLADGRAAGSRWTPWLLSEMRAVRGYGEFGIRPSLPAADRPTVAIKNGWYRWDDLAEFHVNCLAIGAGWVLSVMTRYPAEGHWFDDGAQVCARVTAQLRPIS